MRRIRLRTLLLLINLLILALPLAGIWFLRLYESALIRQTESELVAQAAVLAGAYDAERGRVLSAGPARSPGLLVAHPGPLPALRGVDANGPISATTGEDLGQSLAGFDEIRQA